MAKRKRKTTRRKKRNPARMLITNPKRRKRRRNPRGGKLFGGATKRFGTDVKEAAQVLGGRYIGEVAGEAGARFLGEPVGDFAGTVGQVGIWFAVTKFVKGAMGRLVRLGLLSEALHQALVVHAGIDVPGQVFNLLPKGKQPMTAEQQAAAAVEAAAGASGVGVLTDELFGDIDRDEIL